MGIVHLLSLVIGLGFIFVWFFIRPMLVLVSGLIQRHKGDSINKDFSALERIEGISIIVPCHNESESLVYTVKSLLQQDISCNREIILIENNSTDNTLEVACKLEEEYPGVVRAVSIRTDPNQYPISAALNFGLDNCRYPYIFRIDADTVLEDPLAIQKAIEPVVNGRAVIVASNVRIANNKQNILTRMQSMEYFLSMELDRRSQRLYKSVLCCSGAMQAFKLSTIRSIGNYNTAPQVPEDLDLTWRMHTVGNVEMNHEAVSYTDAPATIKDLYKQRIHWMKLGIICMFMHKNGIFNKKKYGMLGLIGMPIKVFTTVRSVIGMILKIILAVEWSANGDAIHMLKTFMTLCAIHVIFYILQIGIVRPVCKDRQGSDQWLLLPIFILVYQPCLSLVRMIAITKAVTMLLSRKNKGKFVSYKSRQDVAA